MLKTYGTMGLVSLAVLLLFSGCKDKNVNRSSYADRTPAPAEVKAYFDAVSKGMTTLTVDKVSQTMVGKQCAFIAATQKGPVSPPPPPPGMVRIMGPTSVYRGALAQVDGETVTIEVPYPTSGKTKRIDVPVIDIQQFAMAK